MWFNPKMSVVWLAVGLLGTMPAVAEVKVGELFPALEKFSTEGSLPSDRAGRVVLVDFWASWCAPCRESFPVLNGLENEFTARGFSVIGVSVDEKRPPFDTFVKKMKPGFAVLRDSEQKLVAEVKVPTMPSSYLIDRHGIVRFIHVGFHETTEKELRGEIAALLEEKP
jgi:thiol-disulfide isomerase/thioredoxin